MKPMSILKTTFIVSLLLFTANAFAWSYTTAVKNSQLGAVTTAIGTTGVLEIGPTGMGSVCVSFALNNPAAAAASGGVLTLSGFPKTATASATCTAAEARIRTATAGTDIVTGLTVTATGGGGNITLDNTSINSGQSATMNSFSLTAGN
ncbi:hypothetical protein [Methylomicrobium sp. Wu6]|uniref:hypothetical protein n=1 Tax=Methylomicrobium sp. Wu6 TaxID=3107928 RepID=UPI002DD65585|nr:hypothetical protein [Methylomicrobium sp. Wu6]MEC4749999.1 hypothetical protein [Methylomicrobium sp. Wu6]